MMSGNPACCHDLCLLTEGQLWRSRCVVCEGHAQFHMGKPLKASSQPVPLWINLLLVFFSLCFPQELQPLILNCLAFPVSTLCCFHYANTRPAAAFMFLPSPFFRWGIGLRKLTCLPLAGTYEKLVFRNVINHRRTGQPVWVTENHIDS